jgi:hypothetical protein
VSRNGQENLPSLAAPPRFLGQFCHQRNLQLAMLLLLNPPWSSMTLNHKIPDHLTQSPLHTPPGDLDLPLHPHPVVEPGPQPRRFSPFQHRLILSQKCRLSGEKLGELFKRRRIRHGLLTYASIVCRETSLLYCRLRMKASHGGPTYGTFLIVS